MKNISEMDEARARKILGDIIQPDDSLSKGTDYVFWKPWETGVAEVELDAFFSADQLKAMAWWMENKGHSPKVPMAGEDTSKPVNQKNRKG
jgi:hypothetical protein